MERLSRMVEEYLLAVPLEESLPVAQDWVEVVARLARVLKAINASSVAR